MGQLRQHSHLPVTVDPVDLLALEVINHIPRRIQTDTGFAKTPVRVAAEINVGLESSFLVVRKLSLLATGEVAHKDIGVARAFRDKKKVPIPGAKT